MNLKIKLPFIPLGMSLIFFIFYSVLAVIKHQHFLSGYDLAIVDQIVWKYSQFKSPITTVHTFYNTSLLSDHLELIYILLSPFYLLKSSALTLILLQTFTVSLSAVPIYLIAKNYKLSSFLSGVLTVSYLSFYGIQFAIWSDVHSLVFAESFMAWLIYSLELNKKLYISIFFTLSIICKEDIAFLTLLIFIVFYIFKKKFEYLIYIVICLIYLVLIFSVYFPYLTHDGYRYASPHGILSDINLNYLWDSKDKQQVIYTSLIWFGLWPLLLPIYLIPAFGDIFHYFVLGHKVVSSAQGIFGHYRITLAIFVVWPTIIVLGKFRQNFYLLIGLYLLCILFFFQYSLHLPLSYLIKPWFWKSTESTRNINDLIGKIPKNASVVSQNNITPHISERDEIYTLFPAAKNFKQNSPCQKAICPWFRWGGRPEYLIVDTSTDFDIRHFLMNHEDFIIALSSLEKEHVVTKLYKINTAVLYRINNYKMR